MTRTCRWLETADVKTAGAPRRLLQAPTSGCSDGFGGTLCRTLASLCPTNAWLHQQVPAVRQIWPAYTSIITLSGVR